MNHSRSPKKNGDSPDEATQTLLNTFLALTKRLNSAKDVREVAEHLKDATSTLFTLDSFTFDLYVPDLDIFQSVLLLDVVDGVRREVPQPANTLPSSPIFKEVSSFGPKLILRDGKVSDSSGFRTFGDTGRLSASLIFVPLRDDERLLAILSIQSYTPDAYNPSDLERLQMLANQSCGTLLRLEAEKNFRSIFENAVEGICRINPNGSFLTANRSLAQMLGYATVEEFLKSAPDARHRLFLDAESYCRFESQLKQHGFLKHFETEFRRKDKTDFWVALNARAELDENGAPLYIDLAVQDITDNKHSQLDLSRMEALYRRAINGAGAVSYATNYEARTYTFIDSGIKDLIGYAPEEMKPDIWRNLVKQRVMLGEVAGLSAAEAAKRVIKGELNHWCCDMLVTTKSGKQRWISDASVQSLGSDGKPVGSIGILQDITDRKQAEIMALSLAKLSQGLSMVADPEAAAEIIAQVSQDLFTWDAFWVKLYNHEENLLYEVLCVDTIDGKQVRDESRNPRKPLGSHMRILQTGAELLRRDESTSMRDDARPFGDTSRPSASLMTVPIRYRDKTIGIMSAQSYTPRAYDQQNLNTFQLLGDQCAGALEQIWANEASRKSEMQFRVVWESSADAMRLATEDGTVLMANEAYCKMMGKAKAEIEGHLFTAIHLASNQRRVLEKHKENFHHTLGVNRLEKRITLWNDRELWLEITNTLLGLEGQKPMLLSIFRDISERKQSEAQLRVLNQQLIDSSRKAGMAEVASGVLHNVGNVLNSVNVAANVVSERLRNSRHTNLSKIAYMLEEQSSNITRFFTEDERGKQLPAYIRKLADYLAEEQSLTLKELETLRKNIDHIKDIVSMQQNYAKVSGLIEPHPVKDLVEDALQMNAAALVRHDVHLLKTFEVNPVISTDKHKVLQILVNFIRNAKYACDEGGKPEKRVNVGIQMKGTDHVQITVTDNGIGIPSENLTRIFSHGFTTREQGHGFGLHSAALAAEELGGAIHVKSDGIGSGAAFTLELPIKFETK